MESELWSLLEAVARDGEPAWQALLTKLDPIIVTFAARQPLGRIRDEDAPREIAMRTFARLRGKEFSAIKKVVAAEPRPALEAWLRVLVRHSAVDYVRAAPEYERARDPRWISLATLSSSVHSPEPDSLAEKRASVSHFIETAIAQAKAEVTAHGNDQAITRLANTWKIDRTHVRRLIARGEQYLAVLATVLAGFTYQETADRLALSRREVELTVSYVEELLHERGFATD